MSTKSTLIKMTAANRKRFIRELCNNVRDEIVSKSAQMPDDWDGIELRAYIAACFSECKMGNLTGKRLKDYRNTIYISSL